MTDNPETNRGRDEQALEESFEELYEHAPCGFLSTLPDGTFVKVNQTLLEWIGYRRDELLAGMRFQDLLTVGGKIFYETHFAPLMQMQGRVKEIAFDLVCRDGHQLPILINSVQKRDVSGTPLVNRIAVFNAGHRREYERELQLARKKAEEALRLRDMFLSLASHELKTPLTAMLGHVELLQRRVQQENSLSARGQRTLQIIAHQTNRLYTMILSLLDISRIEAGQLSVERAPLDVCGLVREVVDETQPTLGERMIDLRCASTPAIVQGDALRLTQVFQNLIQNAMKYSQPDTPIVVVVTTDEERVSVEVRDTGIGIPAADLPHLFDRFYRAANVEEKNVAGMGIGLYVVKEIVALHGGQVAVESIEGQGSTFTVALPLHKA